jgi:hypothetical protein
MASKAAEGGLDEALRLVGGERREEDSTIVRRVCQPDEAKRCSMAMLSFG